MIGTMHFAQWVTFSASLFAVTNPFGNLAIFISLTKDRTLPKFAVSLSLLAYPLPSSY